MLFILAYLKIINPFGLKFLLQNCILCTNHLMIPLKVSATELYSLYKSLDDTPLMLPQGRLLE